MILQCSPQPTPSNITEDTTAPKDYYKNYAYDLKRQLDQKEQDEVQLCELVVQISRSLLSSDVATLLTQASSVHVRPDIQEKLSRLEHKLQHKDQKMDMLLEKIKIIEGVLLAKKKIVSVIP